MYQVETRMVPSTPTVVVRGKVPLEDIGDWLGKAYGSVFQHLGRIGVEPAGPPFARYRQLDGQFEIEAGVAVPERVAGAGAAESSALPEGPAAATWHVGPYDTMGPAYEALAAWIRDQGGTARDLAWEIYYSDPEEEPDPTTWRTEIVQPYRVG